LGFRWLWYIIQAYLGYYVALKLHFFTPGPIHGTSSRDGYYLAMRCLPLNITNRYFILRERVHQLQRPESRQYRRGSPLLRHLQAWWIKGGRRGCLELGVSVSGVSWLTVLFGSYWRLRAWSCDLIGHLVSAWGPKRNHNGFLQGQ
jgi:hypothetical protein